jgi:hypothetical protein
MNFVNSPEVRPVIRVRRQPMAHRVLPHISPFFRIAFAVAQPMMKPSTLESPRIRLLLRKAVFPKCQPALDGEFQIAGSAKQVQMIRHQKIITHQPRRCGILPDRVQRIFHRSLRQPTFAFLGANGKENPVWASQRDVNSFRRSATAGLAEGNFCHTSIRSEGVVNAKDFSPRAMRAGRIMGQSSSSAPPPR